MAPISNPNTKEKHVGVAKKITKEILTLLEERGTGDYIGEEISQLEHCLQCAHFGMKAGCSEETVLAALLHDIGQFLPLEQAEEVMMATEGEGSVGRKGHEKIGEEFLRQKGFGEGVCRLVGSHVAAKRYLTAIDPRYYDGLSDASKKSLGFQGGPFKGVDLDTFESDPLREEMVRLRKWDDMAKVVGVVDSTPRVGVYGDMMVRYLEGSVRV